MSRAFQIVEDKIKETNFFLKKLEHSLSISKILEAQYFLSAFLSSSRSITFSLQTSLNDMKGFEEWYNVIREELKKDRLAHYFVFARNHSQKCGFYPIGYGRMSYENGAKVAVKAFFTRFYPDDKDYVPEIDVLTACNRYFITLLKIVCECYKVFGPWIDPNIRYTKEGMKRANLTIEDVEEENGFEKGWTKGIPLKERIRVFYEQNYNFGIDDILIEFLGIDRFGNKKRL